MFAKIERWLTLGNQYVAASVIYLGLALILGGSTLLDSPRVWATDENEPECSYTVKENQEGQWVDVTHSGCPEGQKCCNGGCVSKDDYIWCDDGTCGPKDTCECCDSCSEGMLSCR
jgi:hypothetical protein